MAIRVIFSSFVAGVVLFGIVALVAVATSKTKPTHPSVAFPLIVLGVAVVLLVLARTVKAPLDTSGEEALSSTYRARFVIRAALVEGATLFGIVGFLRTAQWWMVPAVALIGVVGFVGVAPTARALAREQERLEAKGCSLSLTAALRNAPGVRQR